MLGDRIRTGLALCVAFALACCSATSASASDLRTTAAPKDICLARYTSGGSKTTKGAVTTTTQFDRQSSLYQVCEGFGAPDANGFHLTPAMQCAIIAAAAAYTPPVVNVGVSTGCGGGDILNHLHDGNWLGEAGSVGCGLFSDILATSAGIFVAGLTAETGPGAVAAGVATWRALTFGLRLACGGVLTGPSTDFGMKLESRHETAVMLDVIRHGACIRETRRPLAGTQWAAVACPPQRAVEGAPAAVVSLPVSHCQTIEGGGIPGRSDRKSYRAALPAGLTVKLTAYSTDGLVLLGPRGWTCRAITGGDGNQAIAISPPGEAPANFDASSTTVYPRPQAITASFVPGCIGCRADAMCPFFAAEVEAMGGQTPCGPVPTGENVSRLSARAAAYDDPPHVHGTAGSSGGPLAVYGLVMYAPDSSSTQGFAATEDCTLPASMRLVCTATAAAYRKDMLN